MVQTLNFKFMDGKKVIELAGLSTDDKPVGGNIATGSVFIEIDTGKAYFYNEADSKWIEQ